MRLPYDRRQCCSRTSSSEQGKAAIFGNREKDLREVSQALSIVPVENIARQRRWRRLSVLLLSEH
jgi:hypothetical protein